MIDNNKNLIIGSLIVIGIILVLSMFSYNKISDFGFRSVISGYETVNAYSFGPMIVGWFTRILLIVLMITGIYLLIKQEVKKSSDKKQRM